MSESLIIRDAQMDELDEVASLLKASFQEYSMSMPPESWSYYLADITNVGSRLSASQLIVAELNRKLVGTVTLFLNGIKAEEGAWPEGGREYDCLECFLLIVNMALGLN